VWAGTRAIEAPCSPPAADRKSSKCKEVIPFYCSSLANPVRLRRTTGNALAVAFSSKFGHKYFFGSFPFRWIRVGGNSSLQYAVTDPCRGKVQITSQYLNIPCFPGMKKRSKQLGGMPEFISIAEIFISSSVRITTICGSRI
jgi:hypothetical protein